MSSSTCDTMLLNSCSNVPYDKLENEVTGRWHYTQQLYGNSGQPEKGSVKMVWRHNDVHGKLRLKKKTILHKFSFWTSKSLLKAVDLWWCARVHSRKLVFDAAEA